MYSGGTKPHCCKYSLCWKAESWVPYDITSIQLLYLILGSCLYLKTKFHKEQAARKLRTVIANAGNIPTTCYVVATSITDLCTQL